MKRIPLRWQHDGMQCGVACLQMVCSHFGREYSLDELSAVCDATIQGVSMLAISDAATELGLHTVCGRMTVDKLRRLQMPCILHWNHNHFVVLYRVSRGGKKFWIADPGKGYVEYGLDDFLAGWTGGDDARMQGIAMLVERTPAFYSRKGGGEGERRSFGFLLGYIRNYRRYFLQLVLGMLAGSALQLVLPFLTQSIVDVGIAAADLNFIYLVLLAQLMIVAGRTAADFLRRWILLHIGMRINISLVSDFFIKLLKLPMAFFDVKQTGDLLQRMDDHRRVQTFLSSQTLDVTFSAISFVVLGCVLLVYNSLVFAVFVAGSALYGAWLAAFLKRRKALDYLLFEKQAKNSDKTYQFITSMQEVKLQDCERRRRWEWEDVQAEMFGVDMKQMKLQQTQDAGSIFINEVKNIVVTVLTAMAVIDGQMTIGMMLAVQYIIGQLNVPVAQFMSFFYSLQDVRISLERINEIHKMDNEKSDGIRQIISGKGDLVFKDVSFKYSRHARRNVLERINTTIKEGKVTAIVGMSGSGKTTMIKLMLGFYPPTEGSITVGDRILPDYDIKWWRRQCGVVMQNGVIFAESVARNIAVDDSGIDVERMREAARIACIDDFIMSLPLKYETIIGDNGLGLSQGQKQRILIARAVYKNPRYLIFDEATNSLDANNEKAIIDNLAGFYKNRTVVIVAHRLSTVKNADCIIVLDKGRIVETGTHDELTAAKGAYFELVRNQLELGT